MHIFFEISSQELVIYLYHIYILVQFCVIPLKPMVNLVNTFGNKIALGSYEMNVGKTHMQQDSWSTTQDN